jgi:hypothetical protein
MLIDNSIGSVFNKTGILIESAIPLKSYAEFRLLNLSLVKVPPYTIPLFSLPISSLAFPLNG